ncbi:LLM class flavin-dependent oxidoreductase [Mycobacteroides abscessus]
MDYGHDIAFGSFITPTQVNPERTVELAVASEESGLDLVTFQDHPYQAAYLETWTLLSYVAARTQRVKLSPNVANLPLRPPAVLARATASLDQLTGGRVELGLGAGAFWDAIEAMGGRRLPPAQAVEALIEAITVIRAIWGHGSTHLDGTYYQLHGAKPSIGVHNIGIWLGAYKPRMLTVTGQIADGWLPSMGKIEAMGIDTIAEANARIDRAARAAGRNPDAIRRLINMDGALHTKPAQQWVDEITELALAQGFSTFIFATDNPADYETIGTTISPQVRANVYQARQTKSPNHPNFPPTQTHDPTLKE